MILRGLVENLKQQHWTSVFIELAIVVLGVFIGMQVNNWNEARVQRAAEREFLAQLREEISGTAAVIDSQARYAGDVIDSGRRALAYLQGGKDCAADCEALLIDFFHASQVWGTEFEATKYDEARRLGFPSNPATRRAVHAFYEFIDGWKDVNMTAPPYRERVRGYFTPDAAVALWGGCFRLRSGQIEELTRDCLAALAPLDAPAMLREIRADAALRQELQYWLGQNIFASTFYSDMHGHAKAAEAAITDDIGEGK